MRLGRTAQNIRDLVARDRNRKSIGAEQKDVAGLEFGAAHRGPSIRLEAERPSDDIPEPALPRLLLRDLAHAHFLRYEGMIFRETAKLPVAEEVNPAVPHVCEEDLIVSDGGGRARRAHAFEFGLRGRLAVNRVVRRPQAFGEYPARLVWFLKDLGRERIPNGVHGKAAGNRSGCPAAHPVGDDEQTLDSAADVLGGQRQAGVLIRPTTTFFGSRTN